MIATTLSRLGFAAITFSVLGFFTGCATKVAEPSGFIANADQLKRGEQVRSPDYEFRSERHLPLAAGTRVYVAPVVVRLRDPDSVPAAAQQRIARSYTASLSSELGKRFTVVSRRSSARVAVRAVVTELKPSVPALNLPTAIYPTTRISAELKQAVFGEQGFTGSASTEVEVRRRSDGRRIYAMMDHTTARKMIVTSASAWGPVEKLCARWARDLTAALAGEEG